MWEYKWGGGCNLDGGGSVSNYPDPYQYSSYVYVAATGYLFNTLYNNDQSVKGEYLQLSLPYYFLPKSFNLIARNYTAGGGRSYNRSPNGYCLLGSSD